MQETHADASRPPDVLKPDCSSSQARFPKVRKTVVKVVLKLNSLNNTKLLGDIQLCDEEEVVLMGTVMWRGLHTEQLATLSEEMSFQAQVTCQYVLHFRCRWKSEKMELREATLNQFSDKHRNIQSVHNGIVDCGMILK